MSDFLAGFRNVLPDAYTLGQHAAFALGIAVVFAVVFGVCALIAAALPR